MEVVKIASKIQTCLNLLEAYRQKVHALGDRKAQAIAEYEKTLAVTILKLKNNRIAEYEGQPVDSLPASLLEKVARGICWKQKLEVETSEALYKNAVATVQALQAELSAYQTLFNHLEEEV